MAQEILNVVFVNSVLSQSRSKGVAPALSRTSVMVALVHPSQTTAAFNKRTHEAWALETRRVTLTKLRRLPIIPTEEVAVDIERYDGRHLCSTGRLRWAQREPRQPVRTRC